jgi:hypothetical protein
MAQLDALALRCTEIGLKFMMKTNAKVRIKNNKDTAK